MATIFPSSPSNPKELLKVSIENHLKTLIPYVNENLETLSSSSALEEEEEGEEREQIRQNQQQTAIDHCVDHLLKQALSAQSLARAKNQRKNSRQSLRRSAHQSSSDITNSLSALHEKLKHESDRRRLGIDHSRFLEWTTTPQVAAMVTLKVMSKMYTVTALFCASAWGLVNLVWLLSHDQNQPLSERQSYTKSVLTFLGLIGYFSSMVAFAMFHNMSGKSIAFLMLYFFPIAFICLAGFFNHAIFSSISGYTIDTIFIFVCFFMTITFTYRYIQDKEHGYNYLHVLASKAAKRRAEGKKQKQTRTFNQTVKISFLASLPTVFILLVLLSYVAVVLQLFKLSDSTGWKVFITLLAVAIKVCGNKGLLMTLSKALPRPWLSDLTLFTYEYATALICRILQMSIPDTTTAQLISLSAAVAEVATRNFFFVLFLKAGMNNTFWVEKNKLAYAKRAKLRVQDCSNDMIVEYLSTFTSSLFLLYLEPSGVFKFASDTAIERSTILMLAAYQLAPEVGLDLFATFMEVFAGLKEVHLSYWNHKSGSDPTSRNYFDRRGDMVKATVTKVTMSAAITCFVLIICIK